MRKERKTVAARLRRLTSVTLVLALMTGMPAMADEETEARAASDEVALSEAASAASEPDANSLDATAPATSAETDQSGETPTDGSGLTESTPSSDPAAEPTMTAAPQGTSTVQPASGASQSEDSSTETDGELEMIEQSAISSENIKLPNGQTYQLMAPGSAGASVELRNNGSAFPAGTEVELSGSGLNVSPAKVTVSGSQKASFTVSASSEGVYRAKATVRDTDGNVHTRDFMFICVQDKSDFAIPVICSDMSGTVIKKVDFILADDPTTKLEVNSSLMPAGYKADWSISNTTGEGNATIKLTSSGTTRKPPILYTKSNVANVQATVTLTVTLPAGEKLTRKIPVKYEVRSQVPTGFKSTGDVIVAQLGGIAPVDLTTREAGSALTDGMSVKATFKGSYDAQLTTTTFSPESGFSIGATKPGIYQVTVTADSSVSGLIDGVKFDKDVYLIVADEEGQLPDGLFALNPGSMDATLYLGADSLGKIGVKYFSPIASDATFTTAWQITGADGSAANLRADTTGDARGNNARIKVTGELAAGDYTITATVNFRGAVKTLTAPLRLKALAPRIEGLRDSYFVPYSYSEYVISAPGVVLETATGEWEDYTGRVTWTCEPQDAASKAAFDSITTDSSSGYTRLRLPSERKPGSYYFKFTAKLSDGRTATQTVTLGVANSSGVVPTPTPTPDPSEPRMGTVNATRVNVRAGAGQTFDVLGQVNRGDRISVTDWNSEWYKFTFDGKVGYIKGEFVDLDPIDAPTDTPTTAPTPTPTNRPVTEWGRVELDSGTLRLRESASGSSRVLTKMPNGSLVQVLGSEGSWYKVKFGSYTGYCAKQYIVQADAPTETSTATPTPTARPTASPRTGTISLRSSSSKLIIRSAASKTASEVTRLRHGTKVTILGSEGDFYRIKSGDITGYGAKDYIKLDEVQTPRPTETNTPRPTSTANYATVIKADGLALHETEQGATVRIIPNYGVVKVLHVYGQWSKVTYDGDTGYVENKYLKAGVIKPEEGDYPKAKIKLEQSSAMNMRASASTSSRVVTTIPNGATVSVLDRGNTWSKIRYNDNTGYCMTRYLVMLG